MSRMRTLASGLVALPECISATDRGSGSRHFNLLLALLTGVVAVAGVVLWRRRAR